MTSMIRGEALGVCPAALPICRYAANQNTVTVSQSVVDVRHRLALQDGSFVLFVEAAVSLFALALQVRT